MTAEEIRNVYEEARAEAFAFFDFNRVTYHEVEAALGKDVAEEYGL